MNETAAVVVTWNRLPLLKQCIEALRHQTVPCDILIVDNASTDGTEAYIQHIARECPEIAYKNTGANIGGAGGFNTGMRWAVEKGYTYLWVMDDDCIPHEDTLEKLMEADTLLQGEYGWLASQVLWKDGQECRMNRVKRKKDSPTQACLAHGIYPAKQATFVSLFLKAQTIQKVGLPIKEFFIWGDDIEYTRRIAVREKIPSYFVSQSQVLHAMADNTGSNIATDKPEKIERYKYAYRNENYLYRQEGWQGIAWYIAKCGWNILRILGKSKSHRAKRIGVILRCMVTGLFFNPAIEYV